MPAAAPRRALRANSFPSGLLPSLGAFARIQAYARREWAWSPAGGTPLFENHQYFSRHYRYGSRRKAPRKLPPTPSPVSFRRSGQASRGRMCQAGLRRSDVRTVSDNAASPFSTNDEPEYLQACRPGQATGAREPMLAGSLRYFWSCFHPLECFRRNPLFRRNIPAEIGLP